jgi:hypothetical protein
MGPTHNLFTLHRLHAAHTQPGAEPVFVCFIDFSKAFDMVGRDLLWARLHMLGLDGEFLGALRALYASTSFRVHVSGQLGELFQTLSGVRQGDPLRPTLFGTFIEVLHEFLTALHASAPAKYAAGAPVLHPDPELRRAYALFYMLFADDLTLISHTREHMQAMLAALQRYCATTGMAVNVDKSECIIIGTQGKLRALRKRKPLGYAGKPLRRVDSTVYLGLHISATGANFVLTQQLVASAQRCRYALQARLKLLPLTPALQLDLFNSRCRSILTYGCQVWGVHFLTLPGPDDTFPSPSVLEDVQLDFLRQLTGVHSGTPRWCLLDDLGATTIQSHILKCVLVFWNQAQTADPDSMLHIAWVADVRLALSGCTTCWSFALLRFLADLDTREPSPHPHPLPPFPLPLSQQLRTPAQLPPTD